MAIKSIKRKINRFKVRRNYPLKRYIPKSKRLPAKMLQTPTAWKGLELIIEDILERFEIGRNSCIEFGVEYGYSTVVFSNYFKQVTGVDIFIGDEHTKGVKNHYDKTSKSLEKYENIKLYMKDYKDWIKEDDKAYDFSHVDIVHNYQETYECGLWAVQHSKCCIFHDTESFAEVRRAVFDIAKDTGKTAYNYPFHHGLGIIV
jgi:hypothetical protein